MNMHPAYEKDGNTDLLTSLTVIQIALLYSIDWSYKYVGSWIQGITNNVKNNWQVYGIKTRTSKYILFIHDT